MNHPIMFLVWDYKVKLLPFFLTFQNFYWLSKNVDHHGWLTMKNALKQSPEKRNFDHNINDSKISYLEFLFFLKILLWAYKVFIFVQMFQWISSEFFFNFIFSSRRYQNQQKLAKKITHFTTQFCSKNLTHFTNLNSLDFKNNVFPQHSQKPSDFINFQQTCFCLVSGVIW